MSMVHRILLPLVVVLLGSAAGLKAQASCLRPPFDVIWSYPSAEEQGVPVNAELSQNISHVTFGA
jgi:hypothetical protein